MGLPQEQCNLKTLPLNISYFIHLFQQGLEGWWNVASVQTAVIFSQKHCLYGIPASLQGGLKPYCTILQIISVCVLDPKREEMKHNNFVGCEGGGGGGGGEAQPCASSSAGRQWPGLSASFERSDSYHGAAHSSVNCRITSPAFHFPPGETKMISAERPSEVKKPLSLTNIVSCNFNISLHLQMSLVLIRARHYSPLPSSRINQEPWQQLQRLMWQLLTFTAENPDISLLSN